MVFGMQQTVTQRLRNFPNALFSATTNSVRQIVKDYKQSTTIKQLLDNSNFYIDLGDD